MALTEVEGHYILGESLMGGPGWRGWVVMDEWWHCAARSCWSSGGTRAIGVCWRALGAFWPIGCVLGHYGVWGVVQTPAGRPLPVSGWGTGNLTLSPSGNRAGNGESTAEDF